MSSPNSASVSPGKPTMNVVLIAIFGIRSLILLISPIDPALVVPLPIRFRIRSLRCWSGRSTYSQSSSIEAYAPGR